jgi:NAD(P)-dependent dehydrogenase (short-subunit alcohol dehydrogenase family)
MVTPIADQVALVTGGGRGIGRYIALGLANHGAAVGALARTASEVAAVVAEIWALGGRAIPVIADVTSQADVEAAMADVQERLGPLTLLVNNAGTCQQIGPIWELDPDQWWAEVAANLRGAALTCHYALARMVPRRSGRIINIYGNLGAAQAGYCSAFAVAKAGLLRLTEQLAVETREFGITVFALHPGLIPTAVIDNLATSDRGRKFFPRFASLRLDDFLPTDRLISAVITLASGSADDLSGRYLHAVEDIGAIVADADRIREQDLRVLRIAGAH